jgi:dihydrofolate reductase
MKRERKIIVSIAMSADGYIARADGSVDWLNRPLGNWSLPPSTLRIIPQARDATY